MEEDLSAGCGCKEHNHFTALPTQTLVTMERQMREVQVRDKDTLLLGILTASQNEDAVKHHGRAATASAARTRTTFDYTIKGQSVCKKVFWRVYRVGATRLRRIQNLCDQEFVFLLHMVMWVTRPGMSILRRPVKDLLSSSRTLPVLMACQSPWKSTNCTNIPSIFKIYKLL